TAVKWLKEYGSLDNIIQRADQIKGKVGENLRQALTQIPLNKTLVTIKQDIPLSIQLSDLVVRPKKQAELLTLFKEYEFKNWLAELLKNHADFTQPTRPIDWIDSEEKLNHWLEKIKKVPYFALDTE